VVVEGGTENSQVDNCSMTRPGRATLSPPDGIARCWTGCGKGSPPPVAL